MYTVFISRIIEKYAHGEFGYGWKRSYRKYKTLQEAKSFVSEQFQCDPYYNYAEIWQPDGPDLCRLRGDDWTKKELFNRKVWKKKESPSS